MNFFKITPNFVSNPPYLNTHTHLKTRKESKNTSSTQYTARTTKRDNDMHAMGKVKQHALDLNVLIGFEAYVPVGGRGG